MRTRTIRYALAVSLVLVLVLPVVLSLPVAALDTGAKYPGTVADSGSDWSNLDNIKTEANYATSVSIAALYSSSYIYANNFGFDIPTDATIDGVKLDIRRFASVTGRAKTYNARLRFEGFTISGLKGGADQWTASAVTETLGGDSDLWGATLTPTIVNDSTFEIGFAFKNEHASLTVIGYVYWVQVTVYYSGAVAITQPASSITHNSATINGKVAYTSKDAEARFRWAVKPASGTQVFTSSGKWEVPAGVTEVDVLVVGGGGSGGSGSITDRGLGGGGAGGLVFKEGYSVTPGTEVTVTVGAGGTAPGGHQIGANGGNSVFDAITALGGGGGGVGNGANGGSGGGAISAAKIGGTGLQPAQASPSDGFGNDGGDAPSFTYGGGGGGGGAGAVGADGASGAAGNGGAGKDYSSFAGTGYGESGWFAGGGGGGKGGATGTAGSGGQGGGGDGKVGDTAPEAGAANTGGGGGAAGSRHDNTTGHGGSGIVIVKWDRWTTTAWDDNEASYYQTDSTFSYPLTGLEAETEYEFQAQVRHEDTQEEGEWSDSAYFETTAEPEISNIPSTYDFGTLATSATANTTLDYFTVTNNSSFAVDIYISGTDMIGVGGNWTLSDTATPGENIYGLKAGLDGGSYNITVKKTGPYNILKSNLAASGTQKWGLEIYAPTAYSEGSGKSGTITLEAVASS